MCIRLLFFCGCCLHFGMAESKRKSTNHKFADLVGWRSMNLCQCALYCNWKSNKFPTEWSSFSLLYCCCSSSIEFVHNGVFGQHKSNCILTCKLQLIESIENFHLVCLHSTFSVILETEKFFHFNHHAQGNEQILSFGNWSANETNKTKRLVFFGVFFVAVWIDGQTTTVVGAEKCLSIHAIESTEKQIQYK